MEFEKEAGLLLNGNYTNENEYELILEFCNSLKDVNHTMLDTHYYGYCSIKRNSQNYNEDSFRTIERIYRKLKSK